MAASDLLVRITGKLDDSLAGATRAAKRDLDSLGDSVSTLSDRMLKMAPPTVGKELKNIGSAVGGLAGAFGGLAGIAATLGISALANDFLETTGKLSDLSAQTDITIRDLQRFEFAGSQVGVSLDSIVGAVGQLQKRLGSGDKGAFAAIDALHLSLQELQKLDPGQQFEAIAVGVSKIPDPAQRAAVMTELFGRAGLQLLPLVRSNISDVASKMIVLSDKTVEAGDSFGDLLNTITRFGKAVIAGAFLSPVVEWAKALGDAVDDVGRSVDVLKGKMDTLPTVAPTPAGFGATSTAKPFDFNAAIQQSDDLTAAVHRQIRANEENIRAAKAAAAEYKELEAAAASLVDRGIEREIAAERQLWANSVQSGLLATIREQRSELLIAIPVIDDWAKKNAVTTQTLHDMVDAGLSVRDVGPQIFKGMRDEAEKAARQVTTWRDNLGELSRAMVDLAQVSDGAFGAFTRGVAQAISSVIVADKAVTTFKGGLRDLGKGDILSGLAGIAGGIGGIASAAQVAIQLGKALFSIFDRNKGRDAVVSFAESFGGFDALHKRLNELGDEGERLWIALTQGVGKNNPDQAHSVIDEIQRAFGALASTVRSNVDDIVDDLEGRDITIPVKFQTSGIVSPDIEIPGLAAGGVVTRPTLALVGESGPEAVVPLGQLGTVGGGSDRATMTRLESIDASLRRLPDVLFRSIRDAYQTA